VQTLLLWAVSLERPQSGQPEIEILLENSGIEREKTGTGAGEEENTENSEPCLHQMIQNYLASHPCTTLNSMRCHLGALQRFFS
jgi:hypothetical protein